MAAPGVDGAGGFAGCRADPVWVGDAELPEGSGVGGPEQEAIPGISPSITVSTAAFRILL